MPAFGRGRAIPPFHSRIRIMPNQEENTGLLRRRLIFADPERSVVRISPDGTRVAFRAPIDGVLNLWVAPIDRVDEGRPVTAVTDRNLGPWIVWMGTIDMSCSSARRPATKIGAPGGSIWKPVMCGR